MAAEGVRLPLQDANIASATAYMKEVCQKGQGVLDHVKNPSPSLIALQNTVGIC